MDIYKLNKKKLNILDSQNFESEKEIQLVVEKNTEEIFNLKFVKSEFSINRCGRSHNYVEKYVR